MSRRVEKALDACASGDRRALEVLRATSMAEMPTDEFIEVVDAVIKAGRITNTIGLSRMLIQKGIRSYNAGVAKGDFVGHPFRGNQHTDSSGASRGGAGGPRSGKPSRRYRDVSGELEALNDRLARTGDKQLMTDGLLEIVRQDIKSGAYGIDRGLRALERANQAGVGTPEGRELLQEASDIFEDQNFHNLVQGVQNIVRARGPAKGEFVTPKASPENQAAAEEMALSMTLRLGEDTEESLAGSQKAFQNGSKSAGQRIDNLDSDIEKLRMYEGDDELDIGKKQAEMRSQQLYQRVAQDAQKDLAEAASVIARGRALAEISDTPFQVVQAGLLNSARQAVGLLERRRGQIENEADAERAGAKVGRGDSGVAGKLSMAAAELKSVIAELNDYAGEVSGMREAAREVASEMENDG